MQNGLPAYAGVILTTAALLTTGALVARRLARMAARRLPRHVAVCAAMLAPVAATVHRRFSAALLVGATGYAMAGLFVVQGGADLALTQVAIETLSTVLFVPGPARSPTGSRAAPLGRRAVRRRPRWRWA